MHAFMPARQYRSGHLPRRIMAALLCALLLLTFLSFLAEPAVLASDTRVFSRTLTDADGNRILVQVRCGADTGIPADVVLQVEELTDASASYDAYLEQTEAVLSFGAVGFARFFDITLTSPDDPAVQYQPAEGTVVEVRLQLGDVPLSDPHVIHFAKQAPPEVLENTVDGDLLQFETSGFSVYAIVDAPTSDDLALIARGVEELDEPITTPNELKWYFSDMVCFLLSECLCGNFILSQIANHVFLVLNLRNLLYLIHQSSVIRKVTPP